jgi:hypothetical protein
MAHDVRPLDAQTAHEQRAVRGVGGHADRAVNPVAAGEAGPVVAQKAMAVGEGRLLDQRLGPGGAQAPVDQDDGLPVSL